MRHGKGELTHLVRSVVEPLGYELVGVEYFQRGGAGAVLRVYIDHAADGSRCGSGLEAGFGHDVLDPAAPAAARVPDADPVDSATGPDGPDGPDGGLPERGITLDDCRFVSQQLSGVLDVEDPIAGNYDLEVSSPGLDRPLFTLDHFRRFRGRKVRLRLVAKLGGRRKLEGRILEVDQEAVLVGVDGETLTIPLSVVESARLVPQLRFGNRQ